MLRAVLAMRLEYVQATRIAASVGKGMAYLFGFLGLFTNPFLVLIALFVWIGASQEAGLVEIKPALSGIPVNWSWSPTSRPWSPRRPWRVRSS